jgi:DNA-binding NarL/FixJ family response regulator
MSLKVAIVEDDARWRATLESLLRETQGIEPVGSFRTGEDALVQLPARNPHVILMDINLPGISGVECIRQIRPQMPDVHIVMLTVYDDNDRIFHALQMGASGYLLKRAPAEEIIQAIRDVHQGGAPMSAYIARKVVQSFRQQSPAARPDETLSKREAEVLGYVSRGYSDKEVAEALGLTSATVRSYLKTIYSKLHVHSRTQAILKARTQ